MLQNTPKSLSPWFGIARADFCSFPLPQGEVPLPTQSQRNLIIDGHGRM